MDARHGLSAGHLAHLNLLPRERQSLMFSATFSDDIRRLAASFLRDPVLVEVARPNMTADNVRRS